MSFGVGLRAFGGFVGCDGVRGSAECVGAVWEGFGAFGIDVAFTWPVLSWLPCLFIWIA
ncbi:hypothetical protein PSAB6_100027 [Paraburkholderia sabiae]|nr:hypothetical protein PSAB6_100027 [Paraburkholderia sabiae]